MGGAMQGGREGVAWGQCCRLVTRHPRSPVVFHYLRYHVRDLAYPGCRTYARSTTVARSRAGDSENKRQRCRVDRAGVAAC
eukprot:4203157-Pyramimonas_sp.AAC.1